MDEIERVAFLGLGTMGSRQAANLRRAGFAVTVWNRTASRAEDFAETHGAIVAGTPAEAVRGVQAAITMVVDGPDVENVLFGADGAADGMSEGMLAIDMSTISPTATREIGARLRERGVSLLDAPVTGSRPKAEDGTLTIMVGGPTEDFERARPLFEAMGELVVHAGPGGHGQMVKLINNTTAATNAAMLAEALCLARKAGVDLDALTRVMAAGTGGSVVLDVKGAAMVEHDFEALFKLGHMRKDLGHTLGEAAGLGVSLTVGQQAERLYAEAEAAGHGDEDYAAVITAAEGHAGLDAPAAPGSRA